MALPRFSAARLISALTACLVFATAPVCANEVQDINQLFRKGDLAGSLNRANAYLVKNPKDAQARFLKGLILADMGKTNDAISLFTDLTEDFPELPEPYNNLAVLYASQNKYEAAKNALEMAIRTHPSYATAHENLGDIYAKMASIAYDKALTLDSKNKAAQTKLALITDIIGGQPRKPAATKPPVVAAPAKPPVVAVAPKPPVVAKPAVSEPNPPAAKLVNGAEAAVNRWAKAWASQDVNAYLAAYADDYAADGMSRADWEAQRRARISAPKSISVNLSELVVEPQGDTVTASFRQAYRSDRLNSTVRKTLKLAQRNGEWRIVDESSR